MTAGIGSVEASKLRLIDSIARSQTAMARILDSLADVTDHSAETARRLAHNIQVLARYQQAIAQTVCGITLHQVNYGTPSMPWIMDSCYPANIAARGVREDLIHVKDQDPAKTPNEAG
ncbi:hypothetical protein [Paenibacillus woosongensis]|uniref:Uncharacterized protein n=1 Tax=Paenibacillus woosongensis TaxID=307580 RepID=A0A7X3CL74_9BACL|nr:hypothetical protein [Paenibacillus woosongensis]MUG44098.1 hypothetical protein [Paenibacillus woosongensis]